MDLITAITRSKAEIGSGLVSDLSEERNRELCRQIHADFPPPAPAPPLLLLPLPLLANLPGPDVGYPI